MWTGQTWPHLGVVTVAGALISAVTAAGLEVCTTVRHQLSRTAVTCGCPMTSPHRSQWQATAVTEVALRSFFYFIGAFRGGGAAPLQYVCLHADVCWEGGVKFHEISFQEISFHDFMASIARME